MEKNSRIILEKSHLILDIVVLVKILNILMNQRKKDLKNLNSNLTVQNSEKDLA